MERERITFSSRANECVGYLYGAQRDQMPCVVLCTGFGGTQDTPSLIAMAEALAIEGIAAFTFDYVSFGESKGEPRQLVAMEGQLEDIAQAVAMLKSLKAIDSGAICLWGSSLGGGHVVVAASRIEGIRAVVSQVPFNGFPKRVEGRSISQTLRLLSAMRKDKKRGEKGLEPFYIPAVGLPGELAVMASKDAAKSIAGMQSASWRNEIAPRSLFDMMKYKPSESGAKVTCPVMVCYGEFDKETQGPQVQELIDSLSHVEVKAYPCAHFDFYDPAYRKDIINDQLLFYKKHLL